MKIKAIIYRLLGYKTIDELFDEMDKGQRNEVGGKTLERARKLTDALLPKNINFPIGGEVYEAEKNVQISYMTHHFAPYSGGEKCIFPKGQRLIVCPPNRKRPTGVYCIPIEYEQIEEKLIPESEKLEPTYSNYSLFVDTKVLNNNFKKIELMPIKYIKGDATEPVGNKVKIIAHICNDIGGWGKGFVTAISKKWKRPEKEYRNWFKSEEFEPTKFIEAQRIESRDAYSNEKKFKLGNVQFVKADENIWIANMIAQRKIRKSKDGIPPIRYDSVSQCLSRVREFAKGKNASVHMPRIGCGLAGGKWEKIEPIINQELIAHEVETIVYDFE